MDTFALRLLREGIFPADIYDALCTIASTPERRDALAANPSLTSGAWHTLYAVPSKTVAAQAELLVLCSALDAEQVDYVVANERRAKLLDHILDRYVLTDGQRAVLVAGKTPAAVLSRLLADLDPASPEAVTLVPRCTPQAQLDWLANAPPSVVTDVELDARMANFAAWAPVKDSARAAGPRNAALNLLFSRRPRALAALIGQPAEDTRWLAAAGCRHFRTPQHWDALRAAIPPAGAPIPTSFDFALRSYAHNPVVPVAVLEDLHDAVRRMPDVQQALEARIRAHPVHVAVPFEEVDDTHCLGWLVKRVAPKPGFDGGRPSKGRPCDALALASNPHLRVGQPESLAETLVSWASREMLSDVEIHEGLAALHQNFPDSVPDPGPVPESTITERHRERLPERPDVPTTWSEGFDPETTTVPDGAGVWSYRATMTDTSAYLVRELGSEPARWESFLAVAGTTPGTLAELVAVARTLAE